MRLFYENRELENIKKCINFGKYDEALSLLVNFNKTLKGEISKEGTSGKNSLAKNIADFYNDFYIDFTYRKNNKRDTLDKYKKIKSSIQIISAHFPEISNNLAKDTLFAYKSFTNDTPVLAVCTMINNKNCEGLCDLIKRMMTDLKIEEQSDFWSRVVDKIDDFFKNEVQFKNRTILFRPHVAKEYSDNLFTIEDEYCGYKKLRRKINRKASKEQR